MTFPSAFIGIPLLEENELYENGSNSSVVSAGGNGGNGGNAGDSGSVTYSEASSKA